MFRLYSFRISCERSCLNANGRNIARCVQLISVYICLWSLYQVFNLCPYLTKVTWTIMTSTNFNVLSSLPWQLTTLTAIKPAMQFCSINNWPAQQKRQLKSLLNWNDSFKHANTLWWTGVSSWVQMKWQF